MDLKCKAKCINMIKTSQSPAFKNIVIGDIIEFSTPIRVVGTTSTGSHAVYIYCYNKRTHKKSKLSFNQLGKILSSFEFEEINEREDIADAVEKKMIDMCGCENCIETINQIIKEKRKPIANKCKQCSNHEPCSKQ